MASTTTAYVALLPGLLVFGIALALILTVNDPVSLDTVADRDHGQAAGVSATAEQFGGALGIAGLYAVFHASYVKSLTSSIAHSSLPQFTADQSLRFKNTILAAEQTGLRPKSFGPQLEAYLPLARSASDHGYTVALLCITLLAAVGLVVVTRLVRKAPPRDKAVYSEEISIEIRVSDAGQ